jgi:hypothetical protein
VTSYGYESFVRHLRRGHGHVDVVRSDVASRGPNGFKAALRRTHPSRDAIITITGCLRRERDVIRETGLGTADEFVLTFTKLTSGRVRFIEQPGPYGVICRLAGQGESQFAQYVGHEMQITGFIRNRQSVTPAAADGGESVSALAAGVPANKPKAHPSALPKVNVSAFRDLSDRCEPAH